MQPPSMLVVMVDPLPAGVTDLIGLALGVSLVR
jgi:hypothetical protein